MVAIGGVIGCLMRFLVGIWFGKLFGTSFPWGTLAVNVFGCIWLGYVGWLNIAKPGSIDPLLRLAFTTGFAGGLTTFSTFVFETLSLYASGELNLAVANVAANLILGFAGAWCGIVAARMS